MRKRRYCRILALVLAFLLAFAVPAAASDDDVVIVLDPGHGGVDSGTAKKYDGVEIWESNLNLAIAKACRDYLEENYGNVRVYLTRETDKKVTLDARVDFAVAKNADYVLSIHINSDEGDARGALALVPQGKYRPEQAAVSPTVAEAILELINVSTHISDSYVSEDDLKIEIHRKINDIDSYDKFNLVKSELEDRFGRLSDELIVYMYEEWFEKLASKLKVSKVKQTKNSIELYFPASVVSKFNTEDIFMDAFYITNMFRFISRGNDLVIVLDIIKLERHPIYYLVELLDKIYNKFGNNID